jgi:hypothetical protein
MRITNVNYKRDEQTEKQNEVNEKLVTWTGTWTWSAYFENKVEQVKNNLFFNAYKNKTN